MNKAKELTKPQLEQLRRVHDYLISLIEPEQNAPNNNADAKAQINKVAQQEDLTLQSTESQVEKSPARLGTVTNTSMKKKTSTD